MPNGWRLSTVASVASMLLMRLLQKTIEYQFIELARISKNSSSNSSNYVIGHRETIATITSWIYTCRYLLPVMGGVLGSRMGHMRLLQIGGCTVLITTIIMSVAIYLDEWSGDSAIALTACLAMLVMNGLVIPNVMQGILSKRTEPRYRTVLCALIYASSAAGLFVGVNVSHLPQVLGRQYGLVCVVLAVLFCLLSLPLFMPCSRAASKLDGFEGADENAGIRARRWCDIDLRNAALQMPTFSRLKRSFLVFSALIPFLLGLCDDRSSVFKGEMAYLKNFTDSGQQRAAGDGGSGARNTPASSVLSIGLVLTNFAMIGASCCLRRPQQRLSIRGRMVYGLCQQTVMELVLAIVSSGAVRFSSLAALEAFFTAASVVDALSAALVMVAAYEIMDGFERDAGRPVIVGVILTVWGVGNVASRVLVQVSYNSLTQEKQFGYHVVLLILLVTSLFYTWFCALPLAKQLTVTYNWQRNRGEEAAGPLDEADPLINEVD